MNEPSPPLRESIAEAIALLTKFSVPLYVDDDRGRPEQFGTGFFVRAENTNFLVSADHVLRAAAKRHVYFYAEPDKKRYITGRPLSTRSPTNPAADDPLDLGVMKLTNDPQPPYPTVDKLPMPVSYLKPAHRPRTGKSYVIIGFPASRSHVNPIGHTVLAAPYAYRSGSIPESEYERHGVDLSTHVVMPLDLNTGVDDDGKTRVFPKPQGMSGSPIIVLYDLDEKDHSPPPFPVVAVGIEYRQKDKVLIGTDTRHVLGMIKQHLRFGAAHRGIRSF